MEQLPTVVEGEYRELESLGTTLKRIASTSEAWGRTSADLPVEGACEHCDGLLDLAENPAAKQHRCCHCEDGGFVRTAVTLREKGFGRAVPCPVCAGDQAQEAVEDVLARARIPAKFREKTIESWLPANGSQRLRVQGWCAAWPPAYPFMLLLGDKGAGKTHLACGAIRRVWERHNKRGMFLPVVDLLDRYRATFDENRATETVAQIDESLRRTPLLVLDDYGAEKATDFAAERVFRLVDERYREELPMVVTTNVSLLELDERVRRRMVDAETALVVQFGGGA